MTDPTDSDLIRAARRRHRAGGSPRSEARLWLESHFDDLETNPPHWPAMPAILKAAGVKGRLDPDNLRRMFSHIRAERRQTQAHAGARTAAPRPEPIDVPFQIRSINKEP